MREAGYELASESVFLNRNPNRYRNRAGGDLDFEEDFDFDSKNKEPRRANTAGWLKLARDHVDTRRGSQW